VTEAEIVELLAGVTRVHLAIIRGLSENHPRSAENIIWRVREEANMSAPDSTPTLTSLPARLLLGMLEAKSPNAQPAQGKEPRHSPLQLLLRRS
jgi:hypothetical protein